MISMRLLNKHQYATLFWVQISLDLNSSMIHDHAADQVFKFCIPTMATMDIYNENVGFVALLIVLELLL